MRLGLIALLFVLPAIQAQAPQEQNPGEYDLNVTVDTSKVTIQCGGVVLGGSSCAWHQELAVHIGEAQYELLGIRDETKPLLLRRGRYKGRILNEQTAGGYEYSRRYRLLLPDGKTADFQVVQE